MRRNQVRLEQANAEAERLRSLVEPMMERGDTLTQIASSLNSASIKSPRGGVWYPQTVKRLVERLKVQDADSVTSVTAFAVGANRILVASTERN